MSKKDKGTTQSAEATPPAEAEATATAEAPAASETAESAEPAAVEPAAPVEFEPTADSILQGLPTDTKDYTRVQLNELMKRYMPLKEKMSKDDQLRIRAIGSPAQKRLDAEEAKAAKAADRKFAAGEIELTADEQASLAGEMNVVMGLTPEIVAGVPDDKEGNGTMQRIRKELNECLRQDDITQGDNPEKGIFTEAAVGLIRKLGIALPGEKKAKKDKPAKADKPARAPGAPKGQGHPGIIDTIKMMITKKAMSHDEVLAELVKKFPDRRAEGMDITVHALMPSTFLRKGINCVKTVGKDGTKKFKID